MFDNSYHIDFGKIKDTSNDEIKDNQAFTETISLKKG